MNWAALIILIIMDLGLALLVWNLIKLVRKLQIQIKVLDILQRSRQGQIPRARSGIHTPPIDAQAKTVIRDTHDLPVTGRMASGVKRVKSDASFSDDD